MRPPLQKITLSADTTTVYDINQEVTISIATNPDWYILSKEDVYSSGGELKVSGTEISFVASEAGSYEIWAEYIGVTSNKITINVEDKAAVAKIETEQEEAEKAAQEATQTQEVAQTQAQTEAQTQQQTQQQTQENSDPIVYITNSGSKYHRSGCRTLKSSKIEKHLSEVRGKYGPCGICNPPQ